MNVNLIQVLRKLAANIQSQSIDDMLLLHLQAKQLRAEYEAFSLEEPEWLTDALRLLSREIRLQTEDRLALQLKELEQQERSLLTTAEKRERLASERRRLEERLGRRQSAPEPETAKA